MNGHRKFKEIPTLASFLSPFIVDVVERFKGASDPLDAQSTQDVLVYAFHCICMTYCLLADTPECAPGTYSSMIGALRHETVEVKCQVKSNPESGIKFSWTYNNSRETLPIPGSRVNSDGLTSSVQYTPISEADFGTLACWASNQIGKQKVPCYVHIVQASE